ncbi:hypothetical protein UCRNP2_9772 [Neofusicoccum parvum UCRNP2]|uniref:Uncharacterized protein n=1 Tax=Botryosphaeria parva (strain UCR-NP2) TaxID=1287680 RepID=R1E6V5_BOTPV|nr:hypothetical protein UCRNP2_9772 [Neofusicoccum parvum UCRNP2]
MSNQISPPSTAGPTAGSLASASDEMANELDSVDGADAMPANAAAEGADAHSRGQDSTADALQATATAAPNNGYIEAIIAASYKNAVEKTGAAHGNRAGGPTIMNEAVARLGSARGASLQFTCRFFPGRKGKTENNVRANRDAIVGLESHFNKPFSEIVEANNMTPRHALCFPINVIPKLLELARVRSLVSVHSLHSLLESQQDVRSAKGVFGKRRNISVKDIQDLIDATARQPESQSSLDADRSTAVTDAEHAAAATTAAPPTTAAAPITAAAPSTTAVPEPESDSTESAGALPDSLTQEPDQLTHEPRSPVYEPQSPNYNPHSP